MCDYLPGENVSANILDLNVKPSLKILEELRFIEIEDVAKPTRRVGNVKGLVVRTADRDPFE